MTDIAWANERRKLSELIPWEINPVQIKKAEAKRLEESLAEFGQVQAIAISPANEIYDGHQRKLVWSASKKFGADYVVDVRVSSRQLTEDERKKLCILLRKGTIGQVDFDILANNFEFDNLVEWGFSEYDLGIAANPNYEEAWKGMPEFEQENKEGIIILVHFLNNEDREEFFNKLDIKHTDKTNSFWYPARPEEIKNQLGHGLVYIDES